VDVLLRAHRTVQCTLCFSNCVGRIGYQHSSCLQAELLESGDHVPPTLAVPLPMQAADADGAQLVRCSWPFLIFSGLPRMSCPAQEPTLFTLMYCERSRVHAPPCAVTSVHTISPAGVSGPLLVRRPRRAADGAGALTAAVLPTLREGAARAGRLPARVPAPGDAAVAEAARRVCRSVGPHADGAAAHLIERLFNLMKVFMTMASTVYCTELMWWQHSSLDTRSACSNGTEVNFGLLLMYTPTGLRHSVPTLLVPHLVKGF